MSYLDDILSVGLLYSSDWFFAEMPQLLLSAANCEALTRAFHSLAEYYHGTIRASA